MNTYFSSSIETSCGEDCFYQSCPEKYLCKLREIPDLLDISYLTSDSLFQPTLSSPLRSGDLLILHAESQEDLEDIVEKRKAVEPFRIILILGESAYQNCRSYHLLNPRYIMTSEQNVSDLKNVVGKITGCLSCSSAKNQDDDTAKQQTHTR